jgi:hypothetical protein
MLRVLVIALVLVNIGLIGVQVLERDREPGSAAVEVPRDEPEVPRLSLLSEMGEADQAPSGSAECFAVGPFESEGDRDLARRFVAGSAIAISLRQTVATVNRGTWVYLPVQPDYVTARSMALTLRDAGFADARVVRDGDWNHSVSLGLFLNDGSAQKVHREARSLGFPVETRLQENVEPRYWIDYEQRAGAPYVSPAPDGVVTPDRHRLISCSVDS